MDPRSGDSSKRQRWQRARALFDQTVERPEAERDAFLRDACAGDAELLAELRSLLAADAMDAEGAAPETLSMERLAPALLDELGAAAELAEADQWVGTRLGPWQLTRQIGRGGMGAVYLAERADGAYRQQAAVKLVRADWDAYELQRRFHAERQILAQLDHPHIARLLDGGLSAEGKPYLVLEYIEGEDILSHCDRLRLEIGSRLVLFLAICSAVEHAHRNLIVHRDLKPSNILVTRDGQAKLLDFGIAKMLESDASQTATAARIFTPEYAAPEQVRGEPVTTSVDVHALGLLLFELLSGERAYSALASTPQAVAMAILEQEPPAPSRASLTDRQEATTRAGARGTDPASLRGQLRGDLDAIVLKALRKDPAQRYASVSALAEDIRRYQARQPVLARQGRLRYRLTRFLQRHVLAVALSSLALMALVGGLLLALWQAGQTRQQRDLAQVEAEKAEAVARFLTGLFAGADPERTDGVMPSARDLLDQGVRRLDERTGLAAEVRASLLATMAEAYQGLSQHAEAEALFSRALAEAGEAGHVRLQILALGGLTMHQILTGQFESALELARRRMRMIEDHAIDNPALRRSVRVTIGSALRQLGKPDQAVEMLWPVYQEVLAMGEVGKLEMVPLLPALVSALMMLDRVEDALALSQPLYEAAIADSEMPLIYAVQFINAYAVALSRSGRIEEQEAVSRAYLERMIRIYGEDDIRIASAHFHLAEALAKRERMAEAVAAIEKTLEIRRRLLAPDHDRLLAALLASARIHAGAEDYDTALRRVDEALQIVQGKGLADGRIGVQALHRKARLHESRGEHALALEAIERVLPFVGGEPDHFAGRLAAPPLNLHARLLHRAGRLPPDCAPLDRVLALDPLNHADALEARILGAACALQHDDSRRAAELVNDLPEELREAGVHAYSLILLPQIRQALAATKH